MKISPELDAPPRIRGYPDPRLERRPPRPRHPGSLAAHARRGTRAGGVLAAAFPDIDYLVSWIDPLVYLNVHQGADPFARPHARLGRVADELGGALVRAPVAGLLSARALGGPGAHRRGLITAYGTEVLAPPSFERYAYPIAFVLDPYFTAVTAGGLWFSVHRDSRLAAHIGLAALLAYVGFLTTRGGPRHGPRLSQTSAGSVHETSRPCPSPLRRSTGSC